MGFRTKKPSALYQAGEEIAWKLNHYKEIKEEITKALRWLNYQVSNIDGKTEEIDRQLNGDLRWGVTFIRLPYFFDTWVFNDQNAKWLRAHVEEYNNCVRSERLTDARVMLLELKTWMLKLIDKKTRMFGIRYSDIERTAHTPIVIKAKRRERNEQ